MDINIALEVAARIWCDQDYSHIVMNVDLAKKIAHLLKDEADRQSAQPANGADAESKALLTEEKSLN